MRRTTTLVVTLAAVLVAIGGPILAAIRIATREAEKAEIDHTLGYARMFSVAPRPPPTRSRME